MAGFRPDTFIISIVILSFIVAAGSGWIVSMADHYDVPYESKFGTVYEAVKDEGELTNLTKTQKELVIGGDIDDDDALDSAIKGGTSALKLLTSPVHIVDAIVQDIESETAAALDISLYTTVTLWTLVIFSLIYLFFRIRSW